MRKLSDFDPLDFTKYNICEHIFFRRKKEPPPPPRRNGKDDNMGMTTGMGMGEFEQRKRRRAEDEEEEERTWERTPRRGNVPNSISITTRKTLATLLYRHRCFVLPGCVFHLDLPIPLCRRRK